LPSTLGLTQCSDGVTVTHQPKKELQTDYDSGSQPGAWDYIWARTRSSEDAFQLAVGSVQRSPALGPRLSACQQRMRAARCTPGACECLSVSSRLWTPGLSVAACNIDEACIYGGGVMKSAATLPNSIRVDCARGSPEEGL
jgi:hypothetical protein